MLERIRKFFQGPMGPHGSPGIIDSRPVIAYTHCNLCNDIDGCVRIGYHMLCKKCEMKMFQRIKLILKFE